MSGYRVTVLVDNKLNREDAAADWTGVRAVVGEAVEGALADVTPEQREDAYGMDIPPLQRALTNPETQAAVDQSGAWRTRLGTAPVQITVTKVL